MAILMKPIRRLQLQGMVHSRLYVFKDLASKVSRFSRPLGFSKLGVWRVSSTLFPSIMHKHASYALGAPSRHTKHLCLPITTFIILFAHSRPRNTRDTATENICKMSIPLNFHRFHGLRKNGSLYSPIFIWKRPPNSLHLLCLISCPPYSSREHEAAIVASLSIRPARTFCA
jgi:hypothetical protein